MRAVREFNVVPAIPEPLKGLSELASNLHWTWDRDTQSLFRTLDPELWQQCGRDPLRLLAAITATGWARLAADPEIVAAVDSAHTGMRTRSRRRRRSPTSPPSSACPKPSRSTRAASACSPAIT